MHGGTDPHAGYSSLFPDMVDVGTQYNLTSQNVASLATTMLGPNVTITLESCDGGRKRKGTNDAAPISIAQGIANVLQRPVMAWKVGLFFSDSPNAQLFVNKKFSTPEMLYEIPEGGAGVQPCVFQPNQPEPTNCGGSR